MTEPDNQTRALIARARDVHDALVDARTRMVDTAVALQDTLEHVLPDGISVSETVVGAAHRRLEEVYRQEDACLDVLHEAETDHTALELAIRRLEQLSNGLSKLLLILRDTARGLEGRPRADEAVKTLAAARDGVDDAQTALSTLRRESRALNAQVRWQSAADSLGADRLQRLWRALLEGAHPLADLATTEALDADALEVFKAHARALSLRLEVELDDLESRRRNDVERGRSDGTPLDDEPPFCVKLAVPDPVALTDVFDLVLSARNDHVDALVLDSIDIDGRFLRGFEILAVRPAPNEPPMVSEDGNLSLEYGHEVGPGQTLDLKLVLKARSTGNHTGEILVWTSGVQMASVVPNVDVVVAQ